MKKSPKKNIHICFIQPYSYAFFVKNAKNHHGGIEIATFYLAKYLSKDTNFKVSFVTGYEKNVFIPQKIGKIKIFKSDLTKDRKVYLLSKIFYSIRLWKLLKKINADIYYQAAGDALSGIISIFCKVFKKKFILSISSDIQSYKNLPTLDFVSKRLYKYGLKNCDLSICLNKRQQFLLKKNFNVKSKILLQIQPLKDKIKSRKNTILWIGRFVWLKQPHLFLDIAKKFPNEKFVMVTNEKLSDNIYMKKFAKDYIPFYKSFKKKISGIKNLHLYEKINHEKIGSFYEKAKLFVNTSKYEGFPLTFLESASCFTPVVSLNSNPNNFLKKFNCGICAKGSFNIMIKWIKKILKNKKLAKKMGLNAFDYVIKYHNPDFVISCFKSMIFSLY